MDEIGELFNAVRKVSSITLAPKLKGMRVNLTFQSGVIITLYQVVSYYILSVGSQLLQATGDKNAIAEMTRNQRSSQPRGVHESLYFLETNLIASAIGVVHCNCGR